MEMGTHPPCPAGNTCQAWETPACAWCSGEHFEPAAPGTPKEQAVSTCRCTTCHHQQDLPFGLTCRIALYNMVMPLPLPLDICMDIDLPFVLVTLCLLLLLPSSSFIPSSLIHETTPYLPPPHPKLNKEQVRFWSFLLLPCLGLLVKKALPLPVLDRPFSLSLLTFSPNTLLQMMMGSDGGIDYTIWGNAGGTVIQVISFSPPSLSPHSTT